MDLADRIAAQIALNGPIGFDEWMQWCLYDADAGFYARTGMAGRRQGDFITSPEVGPLFGAVVGRALDRWWAELKFPRPFVVAEAAAGVGTLARAVIAAEPDCCASLQWVAVETSNQLRTRHGDLVTAGHTSQADWPATAHVGIANELLDNLATRLVRRESKGWSEVLVGHDRASGAFVRTTRDSATALPAAISDSHGELPTGTVLAVAHQAHAWVTHAISTTERLLIFDYGPPVVGRPDQWPVRTYRDHVRGDSPLDSPGQFDITYDVPFDQLPTPTTNRSQAEWLHHHGISELVEAGKATWNERAAIGDLAALRARSRITEAQALLDPSGLGAFRAVEWT